MGRGAAEAAGFNLKAAGADIGADPDCIADPGCSADAADEALDGRSVNRVHFTDGEICIDGLITLGSVLSSGDFGE